MTLNDKLLAHYVKNVHFIRCIVNSYIIKGFEMNDLNGVNNYLDMVQLATMRNTLYQVTQASPAEQPLDYSQLQQSNQQLRQNARETGVELYSQVLQKQMLETYANTSENTNSTNNTNDIFIAKFKISLLIIKKTLYENKINNFSHDPYTDIMALHDKYDF